MSLKRIDKIFYEDPLYYQKDSADKQDYLEYSRKRLSRIFGVSTKQVLDASKSYIGRPDSLRQFIFIAQSWSHYQKTQLSRKATTLAVCTAIFTMEGLTCGVKNRKGKLLVNEARVYYFMKNFFSKQEKIHLLNAFTFATRNNLTIPAKRRKDRHVMYKKMVMNTQYGESEFCSPVDGDSNIYCNCTNWLTSQSEGVVNKYLKKLVFHLYKMRCSVVHDSMSPSICHTEKIPAGATSWNMTVSDIYLHNHRGKANNYYYNSSLSRKSLEQIFRKSLFRCFSKGYPIA